ncbi:hypothetical protein JCM10295v2_003326 [Rhodotorula toruloides]
MGKKVTFRALQVSSKKKKVLTGARSTPCKRAKLADDVVPPAGPEPEDIDETAPDVEGEGKQNQLNLKPRTKSALQKLHKADLIARSKLRALLTAALLPSGSRFWN